MLRAIGLAGLAAAALAAAAIPAGGAVEDPDAASAPAGDPALATIGAGPIHGFHRDSVGAQRRLERALVAIPDPARARRHARILTEDPHVAGTPGSDAVVRYIAARFKDAGLEVTLARYDVYMGTVEEARLELVQPGSARLLSNPEDGIEDDKDTYDPRAALNWHAYSPPADLTREVVYAHFARPEDFDALERMGVDVKDRIVLARNFRGYRGGKVLEAHRRGAAAIVLYSDPAEDGYVRGDVYPLGPWGPDSHVQRGSTAHDFIVPGDPLTPGWASLEGARRIRPEESRILPRIPSMPISGRDALPILEALGGPVVPEGWQGGLPVTYHTGPGPARVRLIIRSNFGNRTITNVIGVLRGTEEPERRVILSNHHDAWVYGAVDPVSGTVAMLELARAAGDLARKGMRPRRTLVFGSWDAEEWTLTGSTEWGEEHRDDLTRHGVACLNIDSATSGRDFKASAVPTMARFISEALRAVPDPLSGRDLYAATAAAGDGEGFKGLYGLRTAAETGDGPVAYDVLGSGSDYTVFFNHIGMPSIDAGFDGPYGVYHSMYDNFRWMDRHGDPGFLYHAAMARLWGVMAYRMANADILPFEESPYPAAVRGYLKDAIAGAAAKGKGGTAGAAKPREIADLDAALLAWERAAADLDRAVSEHLAGGRPNAAAHRAVNALLMKAERDLLDPEGLPDRPWFRHLVYAPLPSYAAETLPGLRGFLRDGDIDGARKGAGALTAAARRRTATVSEAARLLRRSAAGSEAAAGAQEDPS